MQVLGAIWYVSAIGRQFSCWKAECTKENAAGVLFCLPSYLDCNSVGQADRQYWLNITNVIATCDAKDEDISFKFGIFADAFTNEVVSSPFVEKFLYCLWWGLRNLRYEFYTGGLRTWKK
jgi:cyclic nucleotide gated channel